MLILLSCAKTMSDVSKTKTPLTTFPGFRKEAAEVALQMSQFSVEELERLLKVNPKIAVENYRRYQAFHSEGTRELPALLAYTGIVFKRVHPQDFSEEDFCYAQDHLRLTSFCYGLLRPLDMIRLTGLREMYGCLNPATERCLIIGSQSLQTGLLQISRKPVGCFVIWQVTKCGDFSIGSGLRRRFV